MLKSNNNIIILYYYLILFLNFKQKDKNILNLKIYFIGPWSYIQHLDEKIPSNKIQNIKQHNKLIKILSLNFYILYLLLEYILIINIRYKLLYEYILFLYWAFEHFYFFIKVYKYIIILKKNYKNFFKISLMPVFPSFKNKGIKNPLKPYFYKYYRKRFLYFSYFNIYINKITRKMKYFKFYYLSYNKWKFYFIDKQNAIAEIYTFLFLFLIDKILIIHINLIYIYSYYFLMNINFYRLKFINFYRLKIYNFFYKLKKFIISKII